MLLHLDNWLIKAANIIIFNCFTLVLQYLDSSSQALVGILILYKLPVEQVLVLNDTALCRHPILLRRL